jgi:3-hydroxyisobutyrate dehydrogenase
MVKSPFPWQDSTRFRLSRKTDVNAEDPSEGDEAMKVGFIGLGTMGASMASNLQAGGHELQVSDVRKEAAAPHLKASAIWKDTPRQVAEGVEAVFTSLPGPKEVEQVALGPEGLIHGMKKGSAYFDLSTNSPALMRRLYPAFKEKGIHVLDAPVSGGPKGAKSRKLALWIGGDRDVYDRFKPVLDAIGDRPYYVGPIGAGSVAKLVHNCAGYAVQTALAEVFTMGVKGGVDALTLWKAVRQGAGGRRRTFDGLADQFLPGTFDPPAFALRLSHKDVSLAVGLARELGVPMRMANLAVEELTEAMNRGWGERDSRVAMLLQEERAGVKIAVPAAQLKEVLEKDGK